MRAEEHLFAVVDDLFDAEEYQTAEEDTKYRFLRVGWSVRIESTQSAEDVRFGKVEHSEKEAQIQRCYALTTSRNWAA